MNIIRTWEELAGYLERPIDLDLKSLLQTRRNQLMEYGDLAELGSFIIIEPEDTMASIEAAVGWPILIDDAPIWEWVARYGAILEAPIVLSDGGSGHVLLVPDAEGIDPMLLELCRSHADHSNGRSVQESESP